VSININIFSVKIGGALNIYETERKKFPSLKELRKNFTCYFFADEEKVYAYGNGASEVTKLGFRPVSKNPTDIPKTTCRMILEGFCNKLSSIGYIIQSSKYEKEAFDQKNPIPLSLNEVQLLKGCRLRTVYLKDILTSELVFGIILDLRFRIEYEGKHCSYRDLREIISAKYDYSKAKDIIREIRVKTGDLTPTGKKNTQASKFRYENILSIVEKVGENIKLPDGTEATISLQPTPIIIEAES